MPAECALAEKQDLPVVEDAHVRIKSRQLIEQRSLTESA